MATISSVNRGTEANDGTGDSLRVAFGKLNDNDAALNAELSSHTHGTSGLNNGAVTYAKMQDVSTGARLLGGPASGSGAVREIALGTNLSMSGTTLNASGGAGSADWGNIGGTLSDQADLQSELDGKADTSHTHAITDLSDFASDAPTNNEVLAYDTNLGKYTNQTPSEAGLSPALTLSGTLTQRASGNISLAGGSDGDVLTVQADGSVAFEAVGSSHTHVVADITNAGGLALANSVGTGLIDDEAVTLAKIEDQAGFTAGQFVNPTVTVSQEGIITAIESGSASGGLSTVNDTNTAITVGDALTGTHRRLTSDSAITLTLDAQASAGTTVAFTPKGAGAVTVAVEGGATYELPGDNDAARTTSFGVTGYVLFECVANSGGNAAVWDVVGETDHADLADNALDMNGEQITNAVMPLADDEETASFTFALTHGQQKMVRCNHATVAITATVPANATVAFPVGTVLTLNRWGAAGVTVAAAGGVTINKPSDKTLVLRGQYSVVSLWKQATDTWLAFGDLTDA